MNSRTVISHNFLVSTKMLPFIRKYTKSTELCQLQKIWDTFQSDIKKKYIKSCQLCNASKNNTKHLRSRIVI